MDYYFVFGYLHPEDLESQLIDSEFSYESSGRVIIEAENETEALNWGRRVARAYVDYLAGGQADEKWSPDDWGHGVSDTAPRETLDLDSVVRVRVGEMPDFELF